MSSTTAESHHSAHTNPGAGSGATKRSAATDSVSPSPKMQESRTAFRPISRRTLVLRVCRSSLAVSGPLSWMLWLRSLYLHAACSSGQDVHHQSGAASIAISKPVRPAGYPSRNALLSAHLMQTTPPAAVVIVSAVASPGELPKLSPWPTCSSMVVPLGRTTGFTAGGSISALNMLSSEPLDSSTLQ
jgi:hypothetical protein